MQDFLEFSGDLGSDTLAGLFSLSSDFSSDSTVNVFL